MKAVNRDEILRAAMFFVFLGLFVIPKLLSPSAVEKRFTIVIAMLVALYVLLSVMLRAPIRRRFARHLLGTGEACCELLLGGGKGVAHNRR